MKLCREVEVKFNPNSEIDLSDWPRHLPMGSPFRLLRWLQRGSRRSLLMQSLDHKEVLSILVCINRYTLEFPQLLLANILHQLISFNFGVRD